MIQLQYKNMMKAAMMLMMTCLSVSSFGGVTGVGNTGDISFQFDFARSTAVQILKNVDVAQLSRAGTSQRITQFYQACQQSMYLGALQTEFVLVANIPDGHAGSAIARRVDRSIIEINRPLVERLNARNQFGAASYTAIVLHEVGHDCVYQGHPVNDSYDQLLNELAIKLMEASNQSVNSDFMNINFVSRVSENARVNFADLSRSVQVQIIDQYLNYMGDWAYYNYRSSFADRPAPASQFQISSMVSLAPSWASMMFNQNQIDLAVMKNNILQPMSERKRFVGVVGNRTSDIPTWLSCRSQSSGGRVVGANCRLLVSYEFLNQSSLKRMKQQVNFSINLFGRLEVQEIKNEK